MPTDLYARGNGAKALKKRFTAFKLIFKYSPFAVLIGSYVILQSAVKSTCRDNDSMNFQKKILIEEFDRLSSDYEKMVPYGEIKEFAQNELAMNYSVKNMKSFAVADKNDLFGEETKSVLPQLFETNIDLASIRIEETPITSKE